VKVSSVVTGYFKLDGGAMFGIVPKSIWEKKYPADENNMCRWAMRSLLIEWGDRKMLVDTGIGNKQSAKWQSFFYPEGGDVIGNLANVAILPEEITDVFITHLHFDHVGGALYKDKNDSVFVTFPNATYWMCDKHFEWAINPNPREKPSFLQENFIPLVDQKKVKWLPYDLNGYAFDDDIFIQFFNGHTDAMMTLEVNDSERKYFYPADLLPSHCHIGSSYVMAYDVRPLLTMNEKEIFFNRVLESDGIIVFEHDQFVETASIFKNEKNLFEIKDVIST
jgi:glyoxylase-like metal-dependent hydrolase (beta-lactamase superfamily II)